MTLDKANSTERLHLTIQQEYKILAEYKMLQSEDISGVYVIPSHETCFLWFGVIFVRDGIYKDGIYRFNISLPEKFPDDVQTPTVIFQNDIIHPLICPYTRILDISNAFNKWITGDNHIWQILKYIKFILYYPTTINNDDKIINSDANNLLINNKNEFIKKIADINRTNFEKIYDKPPTDDKHYIIFENYDNDLHGQILNSIKTKTDVSLSPPTSGLSWVKEGLFKPLNK